MIVDLDMRLWLRNEELGDELAAAVRRLGSGRWVQPDATPESHAAALRCVDACVLLGTESGLLRASASEKAMHAAAARDPGRVFLARAIDPSAGNSANLVDSARADGFAAIWVDPGLQGFHPTDTRAMRVFDRAEGNQLPVFVGWSGPMPPSARMEFARPYLLDEIARVFPRLSIVISGFGAPFQQETIALMAKHDRVFATTAGVAARPWDLLHTLQLSRDYGVDQRILFGSGFPFDSPNRAIEAIYSVNGLVSTTPLPNIARSILREIVERDSVSLLGLGVPPVRTDRDSTRALATETLRLTGETG